MTEFFVKARRFEILSPEIGRMAASFLRFLFGLFHKLTAQAFAALVLANPKQVNVGPTRMNVYVSSAKQIALVILVRNDKHFTVSIGIGKIGRTNGKHLIAQMLINLAGWIVLNIQNDVTFMPELPLLSHAFAGMAAG